MQSGQAKYHGHEEHQANIDQWFASKPCTRPDCKKTHDKGIYLNWTYWLGPSVCKCLFHSMIQTRVGHHMEDKGLQSENLRFLTSGFPQRM
jgi:hypothetical protein